jgi:hypothetical protein
MDDKLEVTGEDRPQDGEGGNGAAGAVAAALERAAAGFAVEQEPVGHLRVRPPHRDRRGLAVSYLPLK